MSDAVNWPALIKYGDDGELTLVTTRGEWVDDADLSCFAYDASDFMVDSNGRVFSLCERSSDAIVPTPTGERVDLDRLTGLLRDHFAQIGECCVAKLNPASISDGIKLLREDHDA